MSNSRVSSALTPQARYTGALDAGRQLLDQLLEAHRDAFSRTGWDSIEPYKSSFCRLGSRAGRQWADRRAKVENILRCRLPGDRLPAGIAALDRLDAVVADLLAPLVQAPTCVGFDRAAGGVEAPVLVQGPIHWRKLRILDQLATVGRAEMARLYSLTPAVAAEPPGRRRGRPRLEEAEDTKSQFRLQLYRIVIDRGGEVRSPKDLVDLLKKDRDLRDLAVKAGFSKGLTRAVVRAAFAWAGSSARQESPAG